MCVIKAEANDTKTAEIIKDKNCESGFYMKHICSAHPPKISEERREILKILFCVIKLW
jgi:hypothetical protein